MAWGNDPVVDDDEEVGAADWGVDDPSLDEPASARAEKKRVRDRKKMPKGMRQDDALVRGAADMLSFGFADEIAGAAGALPALMPGGRSFTDVAAEKTREERAIDEADAEDMPWARGLGQGAGIGLGMGVGSLANLGRFTPNILRGAGGAAGAVQTGIRNVGAGAGFGALAGAGAGEGNILARIPDMGTGAMWGGVAGGVGVPIAAGAGKAFNILAEHGAPVIRKGLNRFARAVGDESLDAPAMRAEAARQRELGLEPTLVDVIDDTGRGVIRSAASRNTPAREGVTRFRDARASSAKPATIASARGLADDPRTADELLEVTRTRRDVQANEQYREPYETRVPIGAGVRSALSDAPGAQAIQAARRAAVARRDYDQVEELDSLLNPPRPGRQELPPDATPDPPPPEGDPQGISLATWLRQQGGIRDEGGELAGRDWGRNRAGRFQTGNVTNAGGMSLDEAAHRAWEAGFFPNKPMPRGGDFDDNYSPVTGDDLIEALQREERGGPAPDWLREEDEAARLRFADDAPPPDDDDWWNNLAGDLPDVSGATLDRIRIAMRERADDLASRPGGGSEAAGYYGRMGDIDAALDQVPELTEARAAYRNSSQAMDVLGRGRMNPLTTSTEDYRGWLDTLSPEARRANTVAIRQDILDTLGGQRANSTITMDTLATSEYARPNLIAALGTERANRFLDQIEGRLRGVRNANDVAPRIGSQTQNKAQDATALENAGGALRRLVTGDKIGAAIQVLQGRGMSREEAQAIAEIATDPARLDAAIEMIETRLGPAAGDAFRSVWRQSMGRVAGEGSVPSSRRGISVEVPALGLYVD
jgi:hypothetical protein